MPTLPSKKQAQRRRRPLTRDQIGALASAIERQKAAADSARRTVTLARLAWLEQPIPCAELARRR